MIRAGTVLITKNNRYIFTGKVHKLFGLTFYDCYCIGGFTSFRSESVQRMFYRAGSKIIL